MGSAIFSGIRFAIKVFQTPATADNQTHLCFSPPFFESICDEPMKDQKTLAEKVFMTAEYLR